MPWKELARRILYLGRRSRFEAELADEIQFHIEMRADELEQSGLSRSDALAQASREFGHATRAREEARAAWQFRWIEDLVGDLRYAGRALRHSPGFAATAILSLALGIGVNTAIFSLTTEFIFSQPSCRRPETLVALRIGGSSHSPIEQYRFLRDAHIFPGLAGLREQDEANWRNGDDTYRLWAVRVTSNFFEVTGVPVAFGRPIQDADEHVTVLTDHFWRNRLGADPKVLGRTLILDGQGFTVVGVLPRNHHTLTGFGFSPDLYVPDDKTYVALYARLPEGMTRQEAFDRLHSACEELDKVYPRQEQRWSKGIRVSGIGGFERLALAESIPIGAFFAMLIIVVALLLLIACANVASLLLARASSRRHELALRLAIGATRGRIVRQLLAESLLLALSGTAAGLALNLSLTALFNRIQLPLPIPIRLLIQPDGRLLLYSALLALLSALLAGLGPAIAATRVELNPALKQAEHQVAGRRWNLRNALVVGQLAVSMLLLTAGSLFLRNLVKATTMEPGFDIDHTIWAYVRLVPGRYASHGRIRAFIDSELELVRSMPGVEAATIVSAVPLNDRWHTQERFRVDHGENVIEMRYPFNFVGPEYFRTMGIPILAGREFRASDSEGVVILNESFARRVFGARSPVSHTLRFRNEPPVTVIGLARDAKYVSLGEESTPTLYMPYFRKSVSMVNLHFMIRASHRPAELVKALNKRLGEIDPSTSIEVKPMRESMGLALLPSRVGAALLGSMGVLGLCLAAVGLYGVLFYAVSRRIREIGVRVALGAGPGDILCAVFGESFWLVGLGMAIGLGVALLATRPLAMFLVPDLSPADPASYIVVSAILALVATLATVSPALHALRIDPMTALRYE